MEIKKISKENENIIYTNYLIKNKNKEIKVLRTQRFNDVIGEQEDEFEFESDDELTEEQQDEIKDLICDEK